MLFRSALLTAIVLSSLAGPGDKSHAQYYPPPGYYDPQPQAYPRQPNRPVQSFEGEDDPDYGIGPVRRGPTDPGRADLGVTGSTRGDVRSFAALPPEVRPEVGPAKELPSQFRRTLVDYYTREPAGTIVVDTPNTYLYFVLGNGKALRYGIGVGREGFTWSGSEKVSRMAEWPDWNPPEQMIERQPYLPRFMAGGDGNPLGARALYLGDTLFRIHGTNQPSTIGTFVSSGCVRLTNEDITDLYRRVKVGTRVVVLSAKGDGSAAGRAPGSRKSVTAVTSGVSSDPDSPRQKRKGEATTAKSQHADVPFSADATHQNVTTENRPRLELGPAKRENEKPNGTGQNTSQYETSVQDSPRPKMLKQEANVFEE